MDMYSHVGVRCYVRGYVMYVDMLCYAMYNYEDMLRMDMTCRVVVYVTHVHAARRERQPAQGTTSHRLV